jgi:U3 small nucleolar RNA-associated protein 5
LKNLSAGIESNDSDLVMTAILDGRQESTVNEVLSRLNVSLTVPFLRILKKMASKKTVNSTLQMFWLEHLIQTHLTFLMSVDGLEKELRSLWDTINIRIEVFERVLKLKGRLNLLMSQVSKRQVTPELDLASKPPIIEYQDSEDSDDEVIDTKTKRKKNEELTSEIVEQLDWHEDLVGDDEEGHREGEDDDDYFDDVDEN